MFLIILSNGADCNKTRQVNNLLYDINESLMWLKDQSSDQ